MEVLRDDGNAGNVDEPAANACGDSLAEEHLQEGEERERTGMRVGDKVSSTW